MTTINSSTLRKKLVIVGDGSCGKTCLLHSYCKGEFLDEYRATVFETYIAELQVDDIKVYLHLNRIVKKNFPQLNEINSQKFFRIRKI
jgi:small GTP-binding protein